MSNDFHTDKQIKAYLRNKMTPAEREAFETQLKTDADLAEALELEKETRFSMGSYEHHKIQDALLMVQAIENANPYAGMGTVDNDTQLQPAASSKKWIWVSLFLLCCIAFGFYFSKFQSNDSPQTHQEASASIPTLKPSPASEVLDGNEAEKTASPLENTSKTPAPQPQANPFADSLKNYEKFAQDFAKNQKALIANLRRNVKLNMLIIDIADSLWECRRIKEKQFSMGKPKNTLQSDTLVLDSIRKWQPMPTLPPNITQLQMNEDLLRFWEKQNARREKTARENYDEFREYYDYYKEGYRKCKE